MDTRTPLDVMVATLEAQVFGVSRENERLRETNRALRKQIDLLEAQIRRLEEAEDARYPR